MLFCFVLDSSNPTSSSGACTLLQGTLSWAGCLLHFPDPRTRPIPASIRPHSCKYQTQQGLVPGPGNLNLKLLPVLRVEVRGLPGTFIHLGPWPSDLVEMVLSPFLHPHSFLKLPFSLLFPRLTLLSSSSPLHLSFNLGLTWFSPALITTAPGPGRSVGRLQMVFASLASSLPLPVSP